MYVDRDEASRIIGAWEGPQRPGQEPVPIDNDELQTFLAQLSPASTFPRLPDIAGDRPPQAPAATKKSPAQRRG
jgi:hypothetical protein